MFWFKSKKTLTCYYAHSIRKYNTLEEQNELELLTHVFNSVCNPGTDLVVQQLAGNSAMRHCFLLIGENDVLTFSTYQGYLGRGAYEEIIEAKRLKKPIYRIRKNSKSMRLIRYRKTPRLLGDDWKIRYAIP